VVTGGGGAYSSLVYAVMLPSMAARLLTFGLMRKLRALIAVLVSITLVGCAHPRSIRVLFIGNSYTYFNNLPDLLGRLAKAGGQRTVETRMVAPGGFTLKDHWEKKQALDALHEGTWDYVALQDQSTLGINYLLDGKVRVTSDELFRPWASRWAAEIAKVGATPIFYLTWARKDTPDDQAALNYAYMRAARESRARVAPVGMAWAQVRREHPSLGLYVEDGSHPSTAGSYLAACTLYATLFGRSPEGLPPKIVGVPVNLETEQAEPEKSAVLVDLPAEQARALQVAAWAATQELQRNGGYVEASPVPAPTLAPLPAGAALSTVQLEGTWQGRLLFYSVGPTEMALRLTRRSGGWSGHLELQFGSKKFADESFDLADLRLGDREITFTDPKGINGLVIGFRGVSTQPDQLCGTADATLTSATRPGRALGTWCLRKE
jgi:hypothetical protein